MTQNKLTPEDWIAAGFRALAQGGHAAIRVEAIARELKTTKGSFYWHFKNLKAFETAMVELWSTRATDDIIETLASYKKGTDRLKALASIASSPPPEFGGNAVEPAIRDWGRSNEFVATTLEDVDARRIRFLEEQFEAMGLPNKQYAKLFYAAHLGLEQLGLTTEKTDEADLQLLLNLLTKS